MQQQKMAKKSPKVQKSVIKAGFHSIGATIRTRRQSRCLPYAQFFIPPSTHAERVSVSRLRHFIKLLLRGWSNIENFKIFKQAGFLKSKFYPKDISYAFIKCGTKPCCLQYLLLRVVKTNLSLANFFFSMKVCKYVLYEFATERSKYFYVYKNISY